MHAFDRGGPFPQPPRPGARGSVDSSRIQRRPTPAARGFCDRQEKTQSLKQQNPEKAWRDDMLQSCRCVGERHPCIVPGVDRKCARCAAVWPDSMVIFLSMSEAEDAQNCQPCCHSLGSFDKFLEVDFWPAWSLIEALKIHLVCGTCQLGETTTLGENVVGLHAQPCRQLRGVASTRLPTKPNTRLVNIVRWTSNPTRPFAWGSLTTIAVPLCLTPRNSKN